jgi:putative ABC transport system substrate-binding protein
MLDQRRRQFMTLLGGAAAWPLAARAQSPKMLRVGYSGMLPRDAPHYAAFERRMAELGTSRVAISRSSTSRRQVSRGTK